MNVRISIILAAFVSLIASATPRSRADDAKPAPSPGALVKAMAEAGKPGPEHAKLRPLVGDWTFSVKLWTDPSQAPAEMSGTIARKLVMGGRFLKESFTGECNGESFEGLGLLGYDASQKKYTTVRACGLCGKVFNGTLTLDSSGRRFECATEERCPLTGQPVKGRDELVIESSDRVVMTSYKLIDGVERKTMEMVSVRKK